MSTEPAYVYRYKVTHSTVDAVPVGADLVDKRRDLEKTWTVYDSKTGDLTSFTAVRGQRACSTCWARGKVEDYGHDGLHVSSRVAVDR